MQNLALIETTPPNGSNSYLDYRDYRDNLKQVAALAIGRFTPLSVGDNGRTERAWAELVSANYFDVLEVKPALGRTFLPEEGRDREGSVPGQRLDRVRQRRPGRVRRRPGPRGRLTESVPPD